MTIELMRHIDYWLGIPLCFLLTIIEKLKRKVHLGSKIMFKSIMFIEFSEMGSAILAYAAIEEAKRLYPNAEIYFWTFERNVEAVEILGIIPSKNIFSMRSDSFSRLFVAAINNLWQIRKKDIEITVDLELFSRFSCVLSYLTGAKFRVGFFRYTLEGLYRGDLHTHKVQYNPYTHISKNFLNLIESLSSDRADLPLLKKHSSGSEFYMPKIDILAKEEGIWDKLRRENGEINRNNKIIIINAGFDDSLCARRWPLKNYIELTERLIKDSKVIAVLVGFESYNLDKYPKLRQCINLMGKTNIKELISLFNNSDVLISNDGGIVHLASLTRINIIVLFGPETPLLYSPLTENKQIIYKNFSCSPCLSAYNYRNSICKNNRCMHAISVDEVYSLVKKAYNEIGKN